MKSMDLKYIREVFLWALLATLGLFFMELLYELFFVGKQFAAGKYVRFYSVIFLMIAFFLFSGSRIVSYFFSILFLSSISISILFEDFFGRYIVPIDIWTFFHEYEDTFVGFVGKIENFAFPLSISIVGSVFIISILIIFFRKKRRISFGFILITGVIAAIPAIPIINGKNFEPNLHYPYLRNGLNAFYFFAFKELPEQLLGRRSYTRYEPYQLLENSITPDWDVILIIGESINYSHFSLFGYHKKTTPFLASLKNDRQFIFLPSLSRGVDTRVGVPLIFNVLYEPDNVDEFHRMEANVFRLAKNRGYNTYYFSTQKSGVLASHIGIGFIDHFHDVKSTMMPEGGDDRRLLALLQDFHLPGESKSFIVLHQRNSHFPYEDNYSSDYNEFIDEPANSKEKMIAEYDNSIFFQDSFFQQLFSYLDLKRKRPLLVVYASDHGELFGEQGLWGHGHLSEQSARVPLLVKGMDMDQAILEKFRGDACFTTAYDVGKSIIHSLGWNLSNPNEDKNIYYINRTLPSAGKPIFRKYFVHRLESEICSQNEHYQK
uniref:Phosphoethanolamine transferase for glucans (OPG), alkaline phosphatase superfamily n=1 Tax=Candidatus Kentrum sp. LPFa TaxID=2126335 RepID=A0A450WGN6_9GAMM|nr:MAG: Phosphoethanolamine transferase for glucans (OPG), alkaline phosphatase superfamily [Candidatus Kentron sp. LPFa]